MPPPPTAWSLAREARALLKAKETGQALARMKEALALAEKEALPADERGLLLYQHALMLERAGEGAAALTALRAAVKLAPGDADIQLELALQLLADDQLAEADRLDRGNLRPRELDFLAASRADVRFGRVPEDRRVRK